MKITTILTVIGIAIFFIGMLILEAMSAPTMEEDKYGNEYLPPLNEQQNKLQFISRIFMYCLFASLFTLIITVLEGC